MVTKKKTSRKWEPTTTERIIALLLGKPPYSAKVFKMPPPHFVNHPKSDVDKSQRKDWVTGLVLGMRSDKRGIANYVVINPELTPKEVVTMVQGLHDQLCEGLARWEDLMDEAKKMAKGVVH